MQTVGGVVGGSQTSLSLYELIWLQPELNTYLYIKVMHFNSRGPSGGKLVFIFRPNQKMWARSSVTDVSEEMTTTMGLGLFSLALRKSLAMFGRSDFSQIWWANNQVCPCLIENSLKNVTVVVLDLNPPAEDWLNTELQLSQTAWCFPRGNTFTGEAKAETKEILSVLSFRGSPGTSSRLRTRHNKEQKDKQQLVWRLGRCLFSENKVSESISIRKPRNRRSENMNAGSFCCCTSKLLLVYLC